MLGNAQRRPCMRQLAGAQLPRGTPRWRWQYSCLLGVFARPHAGGSACQLGAPIGRTPPTAPGPCMLLRALLNMAAASGRAAGRAPALPGAALARCPPVPAWFGAGRAAWGLGRQPARRGGSAPPAGAAAAGMVLVRLSFQALPALVGSRIDVTMDVKEHRRHPALSTAHHQLPPPFLPAPSVLMQTSCCGTTGERWSWRCSSSGGFDWKVPQSYPCVEGFDWLLNHADDRLLVCGRLDQLPLVASGG